VRLLVARTPPYANVCYAAGQANGGFQKKAIGSERAGSRRTWISASLPPGRFFHKVIHGLPPRAKLRLALGHVVPERHVPDGRVIHHPLQ